MAAQFAKLGLVALLGAAALGVADRLASDQPPKQPSLPATLGIAAPRTIARHDWAAVGPGRVEARSGAAKVSSQITANVTKLFVRPGDTVEKDEIVAELDNAEQLARLKSARAEVEFRQTERDNAVTSSVQSDRRTAEDEVAAATDAAEAARADLDGALQAARIGPADAPDVTAARAAVSAADRRLDHATAALRSIVANPAGAKPSRTKSALALARAELDVAEAAWQKTIVRAPLAGRILRTYKVPGELAAGLPDDPIIDLADITSLRVRAELDERDIGKVAVGQSAQIKTDVLPGQTIKGRVSFVALAATPKKIGARESGPRQTENVIEVVVDLEDGSPLIPGMRVDAFFDQTDVVGSTGESYGAN